MSIRTYFENIATAIKTKNPNVSTVTPGNMPDAILNIPSGGGYPSNVQTFIDDYWTTKGYEYSGNVYNNTSMINALGLVLLNDASQGGLSQVTLSDSLENYSAIVLQGIYNKNRTSNYNTTMMYYPFELNKSYWAGMKDRNNSYTCNVTFIDNTHAALTGIYKQVMIYGLP